jgi:hypothetical protein
VDAHAKGSSFPVKIQFFWNKTPMSTEITGIQFEYADPENGRSKFWLNVNNYLPVGPYTS